MKGEKEDKYRLVALAASRINRGEVRYTDPEDQYGPPLPSYRPQPKHLEVEENLRRGRRHNLLVGGSRSGKTFLYVKHIVRRALLADESRHAVLRFRANSVRSSIRLDTLPKVVRMCYPRLQLHYHDMDGYASTPNGSEIWWGGLDEKERIEKILGTEFCVDPESKVLTADLRWVPAVSLQAGDELIGFPESLEGRCRLLPSFVEQHKIITSRKFRIKTNKGTTVVSANHRFVAYYDDGRGKGTSGSPYRTFSWLAAQDLRLGDAIRFTTSPWKEGTSSVGFRGVSVDEQNSRYLLAGINPEGNHVAIVEEIEDLGEGPVVSMQTSTKTFIHDGFMGHNCTIFLNEASQISFNTVQVTRTRLAQVCRTRTGKLLAQQELIDLNPVGKGHYTHREHIQHIDPESRRPMDPEFVRRELYYSFIQPHDNSGNLDPGYLDSLARLPARTRRRFYEGQYVDDVEGALWTMEALDHARTDPEDLPEDLDRVVVAVDPSGTSGSEETRSDDVGIVVAGREGTGEDSTGWLIEDATCNEPPEEWGRRAVMLYRKHRADRIVAEVNFGGDMVRAVIDAAARAQGIALPPVVMVRSSRGKAIRAEPVSVLAGHVHNDEWTGDRVRHAGDFRDLEEEMMNFSVFGYSGTRSPNRADAYVFAMTDLMLGEQVPQLWSQRDLEVVE